MSSEWNQVGFFAAGLAIGAVATVMIVLGPYSPVRPKPQAQPSAAPQATPVAFRAGECPLEPVAAATGIKDGRYRMPADLSGYATTDPQVFVVMGNEAAAAGRAHDAEIGYLMACRVADKFKGAGSMAAADARYQLARHYGNLANAPGAAAANCGELLQRAETLYSDSLQLYRATHGAEHDKSRLAEQGLVGVRQTLMAQAGITPGTPAAAPVIQPAAEVTAVPAAPAAVPAPARAPAPAREIAVTKPEPPPARARPVAAKPQARAVQATPARQATARKVAAVRSSTASNCAGARTRADRLICSDAELARLDREVGYLQARARNGWRYENEWRHREATCQDRACLLRVFATKRSQLIADINSA
jgi:hypothetical protein